jgi:hypothetical protein
MTIPALAADALTSITVTFVNGFTMPDTDYQIDFTRTPDAFFTFSVLERLTTGFTVQVRNVSGSATSEMTGTYYAYKLYTASQAAQNATDIEAIKSAIPVGAGASNKLVTTSQLNTAASNHEARIADIEDVIPSDASITNKLATADDVELDTQPTKDSTKGVESGGVWSTINNLVLDNLADVTLTTLEDGNCLIYDGTAHIWKNGEGVSTKALAYGYLNPADGKFYEEDTYTTEIPGDSEKLFITLDDNYIYRYDTTDTEFVQIGGSGTGGGDAIVYVSSLPSTDIKNVVYAMETRTNYSETISDGFLDVYPLFIKTEGANDSYTYTPADGTTLEASTDDTTYKEFKSLAYDGTSDWTLTYSDDTTETLADTDAFYFNEVNVVFYAGDEDNQELIPFGAGGGGGGATYFAGDGINISNHVISLKSATPSTLGGIKPDNSTVEVTASGTLKGNYQAGHGIKITGNEIADRTFIGTQAQWDALTPAQKAEYDMISITDDGAPVNLTPGHGIQDASGTEYTQRTNLQFDGATIADDSTNDITKVTVTPYTAGDKIDITNNEVSVDETVKSSFVGTTAEWTALSDADKAKYEIVNLTDDATAPSVVVDTVADGNMNAVTSNAVYDYVDTMITQALNAGY